MKIVGIVAASVDGCITRHDEDGVTFTSKADQQYFRKALKTFDVIILGSKTFEVSLEPIMENLIAGTERIVLTSNPSKYKQYEKSGKIRFTDSDPVEIIAALKEQGKKDCALVGGEKVYTSFFEKKLLDELWITIEPKMFGKGLRIVNTEVDLEMKLDDMTRLAENTILLKYTVKGT